MLIRCHGHAEFLLETAQGVRVLMDPYGEGVGFPVRRAAADVVSVSHAHHDHNHTAKVDGDPVVISTAGRHEPVPGVVLQGIPAFHDGVRGAKRGQVVCFRVEADGLCVLHLSDLGEAPGDALREALGTPDVLLIPVGGFYTIDADQAARTVQMLRPRVVIPMHYRAGRGGIAQISTLEPFLEAMKPLLPSRQPLLRVTREDLSEQPHLVVLEAT